ncbi:hypothetical protein [Cytobacillus sp. Bac17]|uniref:hypothetical protein n=1 Tax=Cytobacillus sp. Bac17 TaxID=2926008 RepID=UPI0021194276|nr:hypothetical protein [Cytobacillus sp. Bac17]
MLQRMSFTISGIYSLSVLTKIKLIYIDEEVRILASGLNLGTLTESDKNQFLPLFNNVRMIEGVCHHIEHIKTYNNNTKTIHVIFSEANHEHLKYIAAGMVQHRQQQEAELKSQAEEKRILEESRLRRKQEEKEQRIKEIKERNKNHLQMMLNNKRNPIGSSNNLLEIFLPKQVPQSHRLTHCFDCKRELDSHHDIKCTSCRWLLCPCGACGCTYKLMY